MAAKKAVMRHFRHLFHFFLAGDNSRAEGHDKRASDCFPQFDRSQTRKNRNVQRWSKRRSISAGNGFFMIPLYMLKVEPVDVR